MKISKNSELILEKLVEMLTQCESKSAFQMAGPKLRAGLKLPPVEWH